jgi:hypothetical protein
MWMILLPVKTVMVAAMTTFPPNLIFVLSSSFFQSLSESRLDAGC